MQTILKNNNNKLLCNFTQSLFLLINAIACNIHRQQYSKVVDMKIYDMAKTKTRTVLSTHTDLGLCSMEYDKSCLFHHGKQIRIVLCQTGNFINVK